MVLRWDGTELFDKQIQDPGKCNRIGGYETSKESKVLSIEAARFFFRDPRKCWSSFPVLLVVSSRFLEVEDDLPSDESRPENTE